MQTSARRCSRLRCRSLDRPASPRYSAGMFGPGPSSNREPPREIRGSDCQGHIVANDSSPSTKIALFRSLFRGREDVYPRRFVSWTTGKSGYAPACGNEWVPGVCEKPRIKCADCRNRRFLPVTDEVVRRHLSGRDELGRDFVMGVYPMLL